jgi:hypothetical protein
MTMTPIAPLYINPNTINTQIKGYGGLHSILSICCEGQVFSRLEGFVSIRFSRDQMEVSVSLVPLMVISPCMAALIKHLAIVIEIAVAVSSE